MEDEKQVQEENLPKPESLKKTNRRVSGFIWGIAIIGILNVFFVETKYSLIFIAMFIILCIIAMVSIVRNRVKKS